MEDYTTQPPPSGSYSVLLEGLELYGYHGVPAEEKKLGHRYRIDVELTVEGDAPLTDDIKDSVDYSEVAMILRATIEGPPISTLERLAVLMAENLFEAFSSCKRIRLTIRKPLPPMPFIAACSGVSITKNRDDRRKYT